MAAFKDRLNEALSMRNITAAELSRLSGIDEGTLSNYKKGKYEPKQRKLEAIAMALNVSIAWLMGNDVSMEREYNSLFPLELTEQEKMLIIAYRKRPDMQKSVNLLLGIDTDTFTAERLTAALKEKGGGAEIRAMNDSEKEAVINKTFAEDF